MNNDKYFLLESRIKSDQYVEEIGVLATISIGIIVFRLIYMVNLLHAYSTEAIKQNKTIDKNLTKRFKEILPSTTTFDWKIRIIEDTETINAWTYGGGNLYITRGLVKLLTEDELMAVMLHEAGHSKELHVWQRIAVKEGGVALFLFLIVKLFGGFTETAGNMVGIGSVAYFAWKLISPLVGLAEAYWSRVNEFWADSWATKYGYGKHLISGFKKMIKANGGQRKACTSNLCRISRKLKSLYDSHPDMTKRIERVLESEEGKKAIKAANGNTSKAMFNLAKAAGVTSSDVEKFYEKDSGSSFIEKSKNFFKRDVEETFKTK